MSSGANHLKAGIFVSSLMIVLYFVLFKVYPSLIELVLIPFIVYSYSQICDLDSHSSTIRNVTYKLLFGGLLILSIILNVLFRWPSHDLSLKLGTMDLGIVYSLLFILSFVGLVIMYLSHRGVMHKWYTGLVLSFPLFLYSELLFLIAYVSFISHLLMDYFHKGGLNG